MSKPFAVVSDRHFHSFSAFAETMPDGMNSRLAIQLAEMRRAADELKAAGGTLILDCGDTFHERGRLAPSTLNPVLDLHQELIKEGFTIVSVTGNHDAELKNAERMSDATTALEKVGVRVVHAPELVTFGAGMDFLCIPWLNDTAKLKATIEEEAHKPFTRSATYLVLHAALNGVIPGIPDHGLDPAWLAGFGFKAVFCGHFHNHKEFPGNVYSVGATTHQTWGDAGTKAGYLIVQDKTVTWRKSHAPEFIDLNMSAVDAADVPLLVEGNYVRAKVEVSDPKELQQLRDALTGFGAKGVVLNAMRTATVTARTTSIAAGASLEVSVAEFIKTKAYADEAGVVTACNDILTTVRRAA